MKITTSKLDDAREARRAHEAALKENREQMEKESNAYRDAELSVLTPIEEKLRDDLSIFDVLDFEIHARSNYGWKTGRSSIKVTVSCNELDKFNPKNALAWNFDATLSEDGDVLKETGSWSGLTATTPEQMLSLKQSVSALEFLNNDAMWKKLLSAEMPKYDDYYKTRQLENKLSSYDKEIAELELQEYIGQPKLVEVQNYEGSGYYMNRVSTLFVQLIKETPKQYYLVELSPREAEAVVSDDPQFSQYTMDRFNYPKRVSKSKIKPVLRDGKLNVLTL